jgi:hypothetical protein
MEGGRMARVAAAAGIDDAFWLLRELDHSSLDTVADSISLVAHSAGKKKRNVRDRGESEEGDFDSDASDASYAGSESEEEDPVVWMGPSDGVEVEGSSTGEDEESRDHEEEQEQSSDSARVSTTLSSYPTLFFS